jgi:2'-5' RNA ligase
VSSTFRSFFAYRLSAQSKQEAADVLAAGIAADRDGLMRGIREENFHMTSVFLGDLAADELEGATSVLTSLREQWAEPGIFPGWEPALFPRPASPRIFALSLGGQAPLLTAQHAQLIAALAAAGLPFDPKALRPHVSLAYFRRRTSAGAARELFGRMGTPPALTLELLPMNLIHSVLQSGGSVYRVVC